MRLISCFLLAALLFIPIHAFAADAGTHHKWDKLEQISAQVLQLTEQGKYDEAKQMLAYFEREFSNKKNEWSHLQMNDLRVLTTTFDMAKRSLTNVSTDAESRKQNVTRFHLVVDALNSEKQPLWLSMKQQVMRPLAEVKKAAEAKDDRNFQRHLNDFISAYEIIHPALNVDLSNAEVGRLDSEIQYLINYRTHFFEQPNAVKHLQRVESDFRALFNGTLKDQMEPSLPWVILSIGGMIVVTLIYSGWRKYAAERKARKRRKLKVKNRSRF